MDTFEDIALSKLASVLSNQIILPIENNATWQRILSNAGEKGYFSSIGGLLTPYVYERGFENNNKRFKDYYSGIKLVFDQSYNNGMDSEKLNRILSSIVDEINLEDIFPPNPENFSSEKRREYGWEGIYYSYKEAFEELNYNDQRILDFIKSNSVPDFKLFINNLQILNLDIDIDSGKLKVTTFTQQSSTDTRNPSILSRWLTSRYPLIGTSYREAVENYANGNAVPCVTSCRNVLTGLFSELKDDGSSSWLRGLQNISTDTNIDNVTAKNIHQGSANKSIVFDNAGKFNYPRFMLVYNLYSLTCDLGAHTHEAPKVEGQLLPEVTTMNDALLALRATEDILIWVKEEMRKKSL